jgi:hypothetical protein
MIADLNSVVGLRRGLRHQEAGSHRTRQQGHSNAQESQPPMPGNLTRAFDGHEIVPEGYPA